MEVQCLTCSSFCTSGKTRHFRCRNRVPLHWLGCQCGVSEGSLNGNRGRAIPGFAKAMSIVEMVDIYVAESVISKTVGKFRDSCIEILE